LPPSTGHLSLKRHQMTLLAFQLSPEQLLLSFHRIDRDHVLVRLPERVQSGWCNNAPAVTRLRRLRVHEPCDAAAPTRRARRGQWKRRLLSTPCRVPYSAATAPHALCTGAFSATQTSTRPQVSVQMPAGCTSRSAAVSLADHKIVGPAVLARVAPIEPGSSAVVGPQ
jgi:hypothetical protein